MKRKTQPKHSNDIHLFIINGLLVAGLIGIAAWLQKNDSDVQLITPTTPTNIEAINITASSSSDVSYTSTTTTPIQTNISTGTKISTTTPIQKPVIPTINTRHSRRIDDD